QSGCGTNQQFDDYPGTTTDPIDFNWQNAGADQEYWGFNVASSTDPTDITQRFKDDGSQCNSGNNVSNEKCWVRIPTDPNIEMIGNRNTWTSQSGTTITIGIRIQAGSNNFLKSGNYTTTLVATAAMN
ncbi:hypothetical protein H5T58_03695, partial [Candidatus Parcubacteria bacterium]|nr:hypothetical protein [Candidatus Parcubacteria bacterium]